MKTITVQEFKSRFSDVIQQVKSGVSLVVIQGKDEKIIGYFLPESAVGISKRKLGLLEGRASVKFEAGFKMSEEELLG